MRQRPQSRARAVRVVVLDDAADVGEEDLARRARPPEASIERELRVTQEVEDWRPERHHKPRRGHARGDEWQRQDEARDANPCGELRGTPDNSKEKSSGAILQTPASRSKLPKMAKLGAKMALRHYKITPRCPNTGPRRSATPQMPPKE